MMIKDLEGIITSKVHLGYERFGEYESEIFGAFTINETIKKGYGENKIKEIFFNKNCLYIIID